VRASIKPSVKREREGGRGREGEGERERGRERTVLKYHNLKESVAVTHIVREYFIPKKLLSTYTFTAITNK